MTTSCFTNKFLFPLLITFCNWFGEKHPVFWVRLRYFIRFKKMPNLKSPKTLNEKILYLKLFTDTSVWTRLADKCEVREYVKECGFEAYLVPLIGSWDDASKIDFDLLPRSFIFKANNGCGKHSNLIVKDKDLIDKNKVSKLLSCWLNEKHIGGLSGEPQYKNIAPRIIAEELLQIDEEHISVVDYKIWCFNGSAYYIWTCADRNEFCTYVMTYDRNWNPMPEVCVFLEKYRRGSVLPKPENLLEMLRFAESLAKGFPCVRIDLYNVDGRIYFGEMTFTSLGGLMNYFTHDFLCKCGDLVDVNYHG